MYRMNQRKITKQKFKIILCASYDLKFKKKKTPTPIYTL